MVSLNQVVEDGLYFLASRCEKAGVELIRDLAGELPAIDVDPPQMNQVLVNLVVNAIQAMPDGGVLTIRTSLAGDQVALAVEDTGIGMTKEISQQIFLPFFTTKDVDRGTGLGLAVVHGIVTSFGGEIDVWTDPGVGSRFTIRIPLHRTDAGAGATPERGDGSDGTA
jgi:signal transduction histidine kinase